MARSVGREYLEALLVAVIFATFARTYVVQAFKIPSGSMEENLLIGDHILVNKFVYGEQLGLVEQIYLPGRAVKRGDVVVFKFPDDPSRDFIKRCVGLAGDEIRIVNKQLHINSAPVGESAYTLHSDDRIYPPSEFLDQDYRDRDNYGPFVVPDQHVFVLGDNRDDSNDSRFWGPVPEGFIKGRAVMVYWSFETPVGTVDRSGYAGRMKLVTDVAMNFFSRTRWDRSFQLVR